MKDRVVVSGGAGFIGSHLTEALSEDFNVVVLDNFSSGNVANLAHAPKDRVRVINGDIRDFSVAKSALRKAKAVFHEAAVVSVAKSIRNPTLTNDVNVNGTLNLLLAAVANKVPWFINASSSSIYGEAEVGAKREDMTTEPISVYAVSKLAAERYCLAFHHTHKLNSVSLRYFNVYGPRQYIGRYSGVITRFVNRALNGEPLEIYGDGNQTRDFTFVTDVVQANLLALGNEDAVGEVINVGSGSSTTVNQLSESVKKICDQPGLNVVHKEPRPGDVIHSRAVVGKARKILGYKNEVRLIEGLGKIAEWWKSPESKHRREIS
jgi:UDP-glucose 4-epimerase